MIKKYFVNINDIPNIEPNVSCIGFFDGVHLGHQALINKTIELAKKDGVKPYLITFYPDPSDIISKKKTKHINTFERRIELFERFGIEGVIIIDFSADIMSLPPSDFVDFFLKKLNIKAIVCGFDFHYGHFGKGDYKTLQEDLKVPTFMVEEVKYYGKKVSSTRIKEEIAKGNMSLVNKLLGYKYEE